MDSLNKYAHPIGRILMGILFLMSGIGKVQAGVGGLAGYIESKVPGLGALAWPVTVFEIIAGLAIIIGFQTRLAALALVIFCIFTGVIFHGSADMTGMLKNLAIAGGFLVLYAKGSGGLAIDKS